MTTNKTANVVDSSKLVDAFLIFGPVNGSIKVITKYTNPGQRFDENLMFQLCLPKIIYSDKPQKPKFQTFLVTKENGQVLYGAGLIVFEKSLQSSTTPGSVYKAKSRKNSNNQLSQINEFLLKHSLHPNANQNQQYESYCYTIITSAPFIQATKMLLNLIWEKKCEHLLIRCIMNIPLPNKRKCLRIMLPPTHTTCLSGDLYLYRGLPDLNLLDYPLREVFQILPIDSFLLAFACILMEHKTLVIGSDNYQLMMIGEALTSLLQPLKWCNVYVPILPPVYGATYLDAPTSYIMGLNTQVTELPQDINHVQCQIYCDEGRVVCNTNSLSFPPFFEELVSQIENIFIKFKLPSDYKSNLSTTNSQQNQQPKISSKQKKFSYLDDLKFNQEIRLVFMKTIMKNILKNYERYIVDVSDGQIFDVVSYLSDQPDYMRPFLSKFLETQLFVSLVDESSHRIQQYKSSSQLFLRIFDTEIDETSEKHLTQIMERAFDTAIRLDLMDLCNGRYEDLEIKTAPATPMKLRRKGPPLAMLAGQKSLDPSIAFSSLSSTHSSAISRDSTDGCVNHNSLVALDKSASSNLSKLNLSFATNFFHIDDRIDSQVTTAPPNSTSRIEFLPQSNGRIIELINEVKEKTKQILVTNMDENKSSTTNNYNNNNNNNNDDLSYSPSSTKQVKTNQNAVNSVAAVSEIELVSSLCDLIERIWVHGAFASSHDNSSFSPLWSHLLNFARLKYLDTKPVRNEFKDGSNLNVLSPTKSEQNELDLRVQSSFLSVFGRFKPTKTLLSMMSAPARLLIADIHEIQKLADVKTDAGRARAFIRLSLERKRLSEHLKTLLSDQALLISLYKSYAFLRCEDEREQFLMYLWTLKDVDLHCYTSSFVSVIENRRLKQMC